MRHIAKLFMNGRSQAVRLQASYRFDCKQVYVRRDSETGDVVISKKPGSWKGYFEMMDNMDIPNDFMAERNNDVPQERNLF